MVKKDDDEDFDVLMGGNDGAEICEVIGTYLLYQINNVISNENIGLCNHAGLGMFKNVSGPEVERKKKYLIRIFKSNGLSITVKTNRKVADFLHIYFEIIQGIYQPYINRMTNLYILIRISIIKGYKIDTPGYMKTDM